ncbi:MAG: DUF1343 domain-containing protein, partial [bacterium]
INIEGKAPNPKYKEQLCEGVFVSVTDRRTFRPVATGVAMLCSAKTLFPESLQLRTYLDQLWGSERLRELIQTGTDWRQIVHETQSEEAQFRSIRKNYLLYR